MTNLGTLTRYQGNYDTAVNWHAQAVAVFRRAGDALGEGGALNNLGVVERTSAAIEQALAHRAARPSLPVDGSRWNGYRS